MAPVARTPTGRNPNFQKQPHINTCIYIYICYHLRSMGGVPYIYMHMYVYVLYVYIHLLAIMIILTSTIAIVTMITVMAITALIVINTN